MIEKGNDKLMDVRIMSRKEAETLSRSNLSKETSIISFYDPITNRTPKDYQKIDSHGICDNVFYVAIHDIDIEILDDYGLTFDTYFPEAEELAKFIVKSIKEQRPIICQCEYGQSRSAACAAAIKEFYDKSGIKVFADYRYYPNQLIFNKLLNELIKISDNSKNGDLSAEMNL